MQLLRVALLLRILLELLLRVGPAVTAQNVPYIVRQNTVSMLMAFGISQADRVGTRLEQLFVLHRLVQHRERL